MLVIIALCFSVFLSVFTIGLQYLTNIPAKKDCALAEISPDFTNAEREKCRKLRLPKKETK